MKISIITICYNSAETIEATIQSVISQKYSNFEYIIVDGGSTDGTLDIINKYSQSFSKLISEPDKGVYDAMNKGIRAAEGDVIGILNSDDFYTDTTVLNAISEKLKAADADAVYADLHYVDRVQTDSVKRYWQAGSFKLNKFLRGWMPPHPTFFLKKSCYDKYGTYNLQLKTSADYELMLRMLYKHRVKVAYLPRVIVKMRLGGQSNITIKNRLRANKEDALAWQINDLKPSKFTFLLKPLLKVGQFLKRS